MVPPRRLRSRVGGPADRHRRRRPQHRRPPGRLPASPPCPPISLNDHVPAPDLEVDPMRRLTAAAAAAAVLLLVACSPDAADFQEEAEKYIESRDFSEGRRTPAVLRRGVRGAGVDCRGHAVTRARRPPRTAAGGSSTWRSPASPSLKVIIPPTLLAEAPPDSTVPERLVADHDRGRHRPRHRRQPRRRLRARRRLPADDDRRRGGDDDGRVITTT